MNESTIKTNISDELKTNYINYAMSVIASRALPDARDGLKPVQRRILYTMYKLNILSNLGYKKVAKIVGEVMGKYHPHGDSSISDALVRMAQSFNMRYVLIDGQGNFGSIDGDPAAAMRYIEARLSKIGEILLENVDNTVEFIPNYDGLDYEPKVLPSSLPNLLINGSEGIAVGMATKIPPHNLSEVIDALTYIIEKGNKYFESTESAKNTVSINYTDSIQFLSDIQKLSPNRFPRFLSQVTTEELLNFIKGPDFPTKGSIYINEDIINVYESGKGNIIMRGSYYIEEAKSNKYKIVITELPYQVNKSSFISKIADLCKEKKIDGITDLRDESNKEGIRIVLETKKDIKPQTIINKLYKFTEFQKNFNLNILALVNNEPKQVNLQELLNIFLSHRIEIVIKQLEYELGISKNREHILIGLNKAVNNIDEIIQIIKTSKDTEEAKLNLIKKFELTEMQANAILDMQLKRIASLERQKIENEYKEIKLKISNLIEILSDHNKVLSIIKEDLIKIKNKYGDQRLTKVIIEKSTNLELEEKDFIQNENTFIIVTQQGYIKRMKQEVYKVQNRGGVGIKSMNTKENDFIKHVFHCQTYDEILFFTDKGKVYKLVAYEIPEYQANAKGTPIINLINIEIGELVNCILIVNKSSSKEIEENKNKFIVMTTKKGMVKKTSISEFENIRSNGIIAITISKGDELVDVSICKLDDEMIIVTNKAKIIKFSTKQIRPTSRMSIGVKGINLKENDYVIKMDILSKDSSYLFTISENGFGKLNFIKDFPTQNRGGFGIFCAKTNIKTGNIVSTKILNDLEEDLLIMSAKGNAVRISLKNIPIRKRQTYGVTLIKLKDGDKVMTTTNIKNLNT